MHKKCKEILEELESKGKIKIWKDFQWPEPFDNGIRLKHLLEDEVDEKYYIDDAKAEKLLSELDLKNKTAVCFNRNDGVKKEIETAYTINSSDYRGINRNQDQNAVVEQVIIPCITPDRVEKKQNGRRFKENGDPSFTVTTQDRHGVAIIEDFYKSREVRKYEENCPTLRADRSGLKVIELNEIKKIGSLNNSQSGNVFDSENVATTLCANGGGMGAKTGLYTVNECIQTQKLYGKYEKMNEQSRRVYSEEGIAPTVHTCPGGNTEPKIETRLRIRKLTPKECFRLMSFSDEDFDKCVDAGISNTQLYRQAGNSIVVKCLEGIFYNMFKNTEYLV